ncbi:MAG: hypothetical protein HYY56_02620 [Candidatus Omnitrophica bacterium]|nr:hypothetical protein [Candidatus Omnitrophota bacterium]
MGKAVKGVVKGLVLASVYFGVMASAFCGTDGYFTTYNHHIEKGEFEIMLMNDFTSPSEPKEEEGQGDYFSHMLELEYGVTDQWSTEFMVEWFEDIEHGVSEFTGFRWENRYRIFKEETLLNPTLYVEYEDLDPDTRFKMETSGWILPPYEEEEAEVHRERILESRIILSHDFGRMNAAFNFINETDLDNGVTAFGYSLGLITLLHHEEEEEGGAEHHHEEEHEKVGLGIELFGALGDTKKFDLRPSRQEHYLGPILVYHVNPNFMIHTQLAIGLSDASDDIVRLNFGYEF